jgi:hypothetical protein
MGGNQKKALQLYQWNVAISGAVYEGLHMFEVAFRNSIDLELCKWNSTQVGPSGKPYGSDWLMDPCPLLLRLVRSDTLVTAKSRAWTAMGRTGRAIMHADVLAQLSFATWRFLLPDNDPGRKYLWAQAVSHAFPHLHQPELELTKSVTGIYELRNRVAHLEPLLKHVNVKDQHNNMRSVLSQISPALETWYISNQRITTLIKNRPQPS